MATRSYMSMAVAMFQPLFGSPRRLSAGIETSVKKISLKCLPPSIWWIGRISTPGASSGTMRHRDAGVLGHACVGAGDDHAIVGDVGKRGPDLLAVDHPGVAVALRFGLKAGDVGAGAGLGEHLAPDFVAGDVVGEVGGLLLVGAVLGEHWEAHAVADRELERHVPGSCRIPRRQMRSCSLVRPWPPYSLG